VLYEARRGIQEAPDCSVRFLQLFSGRRIAMKRRDFLTVAAGIGAGSVVAGATRSTMAAERREPGPSPIGLVGTKPADKPEEETLQLYKCKVCGTIVQILKSGKPSLAHCGKPMELLVEKTEDKGKEKHVPVIEKIDGGYKVKVGSVAHPMTDDHMIAGIQLISEGSICSKALKAGDKPEAVFMTDAEEVMARAYCNLHGLWKSE
jgi:superoxide reductase